MNTKIKWGILGTGKIAHTFAADLLRYEHAELYAIASRSLEKVKDFSQQFQVPHYYDSYEALVQNPEVDIVYIATPHSFHCENTLLCFEHDKAVLCEKPMGISSKEVQLMVQMAREKQLFLMEAIWTRFMPTTEKLMELLAKNTIGDIITVTADFGFKTPINPEGRLFNKELGGGALLDIGLYPIYLSLITLGIPDSIKATARMTSTGVDSYCGMLFGYANGAKAMLSCTLESDTPTEAFIYGTKGHIKLHRRFHEARQITVYLDDTEPETFELPYSGNGYLHEIEEVNQYLLNEQLESSKLPLQLSLDLMTIIDRVKEEIGLQY